jgi:DNA-binding transcriptional ArsR family regulator
MGKNAFLKAELTTLFGDQKENLEKAAACLKVLAHPTRLQIICALRNEKQIVQDLEFLTRLSQTTLFQHLSLLKNRDVLTSRREANYLFYRIANHKHGRTFQSDSRYILS